MPAGAPAEPAPAGGRPVPDRGPRHRARRLRRHGRRPSRTPTVLLSVLVGLAVWSVVAAPARAQSDGDGDPAPTTSTTFEDAVPGRIIPEPNTGRPPEDPGDRGGWQQYLVLGLLFAGLAVIVGLVAREAGRKRRPSRPDD